MAESRLDEPNVGIGRSSNAGAFELAGMEESERKRTKRRPAARLLAKQLGQREMREALVESAGLMGPDGRGYDDGASFPNTGIGGSCRRA